MAHVRYFVFILLVSLILIAPLIFQGFAPIVPTATGPLRLGLYDLWSMSGHMPGFPNRAEALSHIVLTVDLGTGLAIRGAAFIGAVVLITIWFWPSETALSQLLDQIFMSKVRVGMRARRFCLVVLAALPLMFAWNALAYHALENPDGFHKTFGISRPDIGKRFQMPTDPAIPF